MIKDIAIHETGNGGDANLLGNDIELTGAIFNHIYLAMFGGNPGFSTTGNEIESEQRGDWWGNSLLLSNTPELQFNSETEHILNITPLNSQGREKIIEAVKKDLEFLSNFGAVTVDVSILSDDKVEIDVLVEEPDNQTERTFQFIWDATKQELITEITI